MKIDREYQSMSIVIIVGMVLVVGAAILPPFIGLPRDAASMIGDWIAGTAAVVLQILAVFLLYRTYQSQKQELREQQELLRLANEENRRKRFEDGFHMLLGRYSAVVEKLEVPTNNVYQARRVFPGLSDECMSLISAQDPIDKLKSFFEERDWWLGDWLRAVLMVIKYVRESDLKPNDKNEYLKLFRGFFSPPEAKTLLANLVTRENSVTAKFLLENDFFKYSYVSREKCYAVLELIVKNKHGIQIYRSQSNRLVDEE